MCERAGRRCSCPFFSRGILGVSLAGPAAKHLPGFTKRSMRCRPPLAVTHSAASLAVCGTKAAWKRGGGQRGMEH